ncbi:MAG: 3-deoxy-7-phosphoheptulonate synthase, partial [Armatimonadota bacterium]
NTLDLSAVPVVKELSHLPIVVDPSHATGHSRYISAMSRAAVASGADGLIIEVHANPKAALCDGLQSLRPESFVKIMAEVKSIASAVGRK